MDLVSTVRSGEAKLTLLLGGSAGASSDTCTTTTPSLGTGAGRRALLPRAGDISSTMGLPSFFITAGLPAVLALWMAALLTGATILRLSSHTPLPAPLPGDNDTAPRICRRRSRNLSRVLSDSYTLLEEG